VEAGLRWSFGSSPDSIRHGYTINPTGAPLQPSSSSSSSSSAASSAAVSWRPLTVSSFAGGTTASTGGAGAPSTGSIREDGSVVSLQLVSGALASIVYRMLDEDSE
jgi:hypothetical protein